MNKIKLLKSTNSCFAISLIILGILLIGYPKTAVGFLCKVLGMVLLIGGIIRILCYFTKDLFQLAFQFDLGLGIVSMIVGIIMLFQTENLDRAVSGFLGIMILVNAALKIQTAVEAKRFGIQKWWIILGISLVVINVGIVLIAMPSKTIVFVTQLIGISLFFDGFLNLWVVQHTVKS